MNKKMKKISTIGSAVLMIVLLTSIISVATPTVSAEQEIGLWKYGGILKLPPKEIYNNVWGASGAERASGTLTSYIYYKTNGNFGWEWNRPNPIRDSSGRLFPLYPEVVLDKDSSYFPKKIRDISSLTVDLEYKYVNAPTGGYNLAYDIWVVNDKTTAAEVMIWLDCTGGCNPGTYKGDFNDGYNTYSLYTRGPENGFAWDYYAFILKDRGSGSNKVDIKALFDKIDLNKDWKIDFVNLGNEIWSGSGRIEISKYVLSINSVSTPTPVPTPIVTPTPTPIVTPTPTPIVTPTPTPIVTPTPTPIVTPTPTPIVTPVPSENLAPNPDFESDPSIDYYTHVIPGNSGTAFSWTSDQNHSESRSLKIVANNTDNDNMSRWMSNNTILNATAGHIYNASIYLKTNNLTDGSYADITTTFWDGPPGPDTIIGIFSSDSIRRTTNWTQTNVSAIAPKDAQYVRLEFRLWGSGTVWFDDVTLTTEEVPSLP